MSRTALLINVGGTPNPIAYSIDHHQPEKVIFFASKTSRAEIETKVRPLVSHQWRDQEIVTTPDHQDLTRCIEVLSRDLPQKLDVLGIGWRDVVVDFTGGTKTMSAALVLATINTCRSAYPVKRSKNRCPNSTVPRQSSWSPPPRADSSAHLSQPPQPRERLCRNRLVGLWIGPHQIFHKPNEISSHRWEATMQPLPQMLRQFATVTLRILGALLLQKRHHLHQSAIHDYGRQPFRELHVLVTTALCSLPGIRRPLLFHSLNHGFSPPQSWRRRDHVPSLHLRQSATGVSQVHS